MERKLLERIPCLLFLLKQKRKLQGVGSRRGRRRPVRTSSSLQAGLKRHLLFSLNVGLKSGPWIGKSCTNPLRSIAIWSF